MTGLGSGNGNAVNSTLSATKEYKVNSLGASYKVSSALKVMGLYDAQKADGGTTADRTHTALSAVYVTGPSQISGTLGSYKTNIAVAGSTSSTASYYTFGYDYYLDAKATSAVYARYTTTDNKTVAAPGAYSTVAVGYRLGF